MQIVFFTMAQDGSIQHHDQAIGRLLRPQVSETWMDARMEDVHARMWTGVEELRWLMEPREMTTSSPARRNISNALSMAADDVSPPHPTPGCLRAIDETLRNDAAELANVLEYIKEQDCFLQCPICYERNGDRVMDCHELPHRDDTGGLKGIVHSLCSTCWNNLKAKCCPLCREPVRVYDLPGLLVPIIDQTIIGG